MLKYFTILANFSAVVLLLALIVTPIYFAKNFAKVAGVKSESKFLVVSQVEKFPNLKLSQQGDKYQIFFTKLGSPQAFLGILILNNPTSSPQTYSLKVISDTTSGTVSGQLRPFFGEDLSNLLTRILLPTTASIPISLYSGPEATGESQLVEFKIIANSE